MHPNIVGMKDSSGNVARIGELVQATRTARKRTVPVTTVFAAVTARMLADTQAPESGGPRHVRVAADQLACRNTAIAAAPPRPALKTRTREVGFQLLCGSAQTLVCLRSRRALRVGCWRWLTFAPQAACEVYTAWADKDSGLATEKQARIAQAGIEICGERWGSRGQVCARFEWVLWRPAADAVAAVERVKNSGGGSFAG